MQLAEWRGGTAARIARERRQLDGQTVIKEEKMPDGRLKLILKDERTGEFADSCATLEMCRSAANGDRDHACSVSAACAAASRASGPGRESS